jgi:hypothetical protein
MTEKKWTLKGYKLSEYPEVEPESVDFPKEIYIAYAVCGKKCGASSLIVDGGPQVCDYCGKSMFRTEVRKYVLAPQRKTKKLEK